MGDKYILELEDKPLCVFDEDTQTYFPRLHRVKGFNSLVFDQNGLNMLTPYTEPDLEQVRKEAYQKGYKEGCDAKFRRLTGSEYQCGLSDAWECARKIINLPNMEERENIFGRAFSNDVIKDYPVGECIEKIKAYEQEQEERDGLRQNIQTIVDQCGYTLDEISEVLKKMKEVQGE